MYAIGAGGHVRVCAASASIIARHTDDTTRTEIVTDGVDGSAVLRGLTAAGWWRLEGTDVASARVWVRPADPCAAASGIVGGALASPHQRGDLVIIQLRLTDQFGNSCTDAALRAGAASVFARCDGDRGLLVRVWSRVPVTHGELIDSGDGELVLRFMPPPHPLASSPRGCFGVPLRWQRERAGKLLYFSRSKAEWAPWHFVLRHGVLRGRPCEDDKEDDASDERRTWAVSIAVRHSSVSEYVSDAALPAPTCHAPSLCFQVVPADGADGRAVPVANLCGVASDGAKSALRWLRLLQLASTDTDDNTDNEEGAPDRIVSEADAAEHGVVEGDDVSIDITIDGVAIPTSPVRQRLLSPLPCPAPHNDDQGTTAEPVPPSSPSPVAPPESAARPLTPAQRRALRRRERISTVAPDQPPSPPQQIGADDASVRVVASAGDVAAREFAAAIAGGRSVPPPPPQVAPPRRWTPESSRSTPRQPHTQAEEREHQRSWRSPSSLPSPHNSSPTTRVDKKERRSSPQNLSPVARLPREAEPNPPSRVPPVAVPVLNEPLIHGVPLKAVARRAATGSPKRVWRRSTAAESRGPTTRAEHEGQLGRGQYGRQSRMQEHGNIFSMLAAECDVPKRASASNSGGIEAAADVDDGTPPHSTYDEVPDTTLTPASHDTPGPSHDGTSSPAHGHEDVPEQDHIAEEFVGNARTRANALSATVGDFVAALGDSHAHGDDGDVSVTDESERDGGGASSARNVREGNEERGIRERATDGVIRVDGDPAPLEQGSAGSLRRRSVPPPIDTSVTDDAEEENRYQSREGSRTTFALRESESPRKSEDDLADTSSPKTQAVTNIPRDGLTRSNSGARMTKDKHARTSMRSSTRERERGWGRPSTARPTTGEPRNGSHDKSRSESADCRPETKVNERGRSGAASLAKRASSVGADRRRDRQRSLSPGERARARASQSHDDGWREARRRGRERESLPPAALYARHSVRKTWGGSGDNLEAAARDWTHMRARLSTSRLSGSSPPPQAVPANITTRNATYDSEKRHANNVMRFGGGRSLSSSPSNRSFFDLYPKLTHWKSEGSKSPSAQRVDAAVGELLGEQMRYNDDEAAWKRVVKWLADHGQGAYAPLFQHHGIIRLSLVELLSLEDLENIGVAPVDRPTLMRAAEHFSLATRQWAQRCESEPDPDISPRRRPSANFRGGFSTRSELPRRSDTRGLPIPPPVSSLTTPTTPAEAAVSSPPVELLPGSAAHRPTRVPPAPPLAPEV